MIELSENLIWEKLNKEKNNSLDIDWLYEVYSLTLSKDLRIAISENLGMQKDKGWPAIRLLITNYGSQSELIHAAGLCEEPEARDLLISILFSKKEPNLKIVQALAHWGGHLPEDLIRQILQEQSIEMKLAGLELLKFKASQLNDLSLLSLLEEVIHDTNDPIIISLLKILKRRDEPSIINKIGEIAEKGSKLMSQEALLALGCIETKYSHEILLKLSNTLPDSERRNFARKQLKHQYRF